MPLLALWNSNPTAISESTIEQIVAIAGDGSLKDASSCSTELRGYLAQVSSTKLAGYVEHCLSLSFSKSGIVLQDIINELGRRLDYKVVNGRYQGTPTAIGYDGIWESPEGHTIILEVKTTDTYRISLDTIAGYRQKLSSAGKIEGHSSMLIVVGREDTGELEAQIRGSRHAWDIRLISADALIKLVHLKENSDSADTGQKIRSLLTPMEFTRLDNMIDVMFTTVADVEAAIVEEATDKDDDDLSSAAVELGSKSGWQFTDFAVLDQKRAKIIEAIANKLGVKLIKKTRALFWDAAHEKRAVCSVSKRYLKRASYPYWYAYHPEWDEFLGAGTDAYFVLGCMDLPFAFAIPLATFRANLDALNTTTTQRSTYWHIHLIETEQKNYRLLLPKKSQHLSIDEFRINL